MNHATEMKRWRELKRVEATLEGPILVLGLVWLVLIVIDLAWGTTRTLDLLMSLIWGLFIIDFLVKLVLAPKKMSYVGHNWLTVLALFVPALRIFRIARLGSFFRLARTARGARLLKIFSSLNRGVKSLKKSLQRRGFGYVLAITGVVIILGASGMLAFEKRVEGSQIHDFGTALWWTTMILTTMGTDYFPKSAEGRILCLFLAVYGFAVFGYVTATVATFFVGKENEKRPPADESILHDIQEQIHRLHIELQRRQF